MAIAQEDPTRPIAVTVNQNLSFGTFYQGAGGGTVTINNVGTRFAGGTVVLLTGSYSTAIFNIFANRGTLVSFVLPSTSSLIDGSGHSLGLTIDAAGNPNSDFVSGNIHSTPTQKSFGGILTIPAAIQPGNYSGTFEIIIVEQ